MECIMRLITSGMYYNTYNEWCAYMDMKDKGRIQADPVGPDLF